MLGNLLLDDVVREDGSTRMAQPGGAALYAALGAALWETRVRIVAPVGSDYPAAVLDGLAARGVDLGGLRRLDGPGLRTWLLYEGRQRRVVHRLSGPTHAAVSPTPGDLPAAAGAHAIHLAPMPWEVQRRLVEALAARRASPTAAPPVPVGGRRLDPAEPHATPPDAPSDGPSDGLVSLDPYELVTTERLDAWRELLAGVDLLLLSEDELAVEGALEDPRPILRELAAAGGRLRWILLKRGARGGLTYDVGNNEFAVWEPRAAAVVDPTGAGDAFAGGLLAGLLRGEDMTTAVERGVVAASLALEAPGPDGLLAATPAVALERRRRWFTNSTATEDHPPTQPYPASGSADRENAGERGLPEPTAAGRRRLGRKEPHRREPRQQGPRG